MVVRHVVSASTEVRGVFNLYDAPSAESSSFLTESVARADPVRDADGECLAGACLARERALDRGWVRGPPKGKAV